MTLYPFGITPYYREKCELVFGWLLRRTTPDLYYYRTTRGKEIDFVWVDSRRNKNLVQVCITLNDPLTVKREITSLLQAMEELNLKESKIVSLQEEKAIENLDFI